MQSFKHSDLGVYFFYKNLEKEVIILKQIDTHYFHTLATEASDGTAYTVTSDGSAITFSVQGDSSSRTLVFEASINGTDFFAVKCANLTTLALATQTTGNNELWQVDLTGFYKFRVRINAIDGGNVTVFGRVVDA